MEESEAIVITVDDVITITIPPGLVDAITEGGDNLDDLHLDVVVWPPCPDSDNFELAVEISLTQDGEAISEVDVPITIEVNLSGFDIEGVNPVQIVVVLADGTLIVGQMDSATGIFTFETAVIGDFTIAYMPNLRIIGLQIGSYDIINVLLGTLLVEMDVVPVMQNNRTLIPLRFVAEVLGAEWDWDPDGRIVTLISGADVLSFAIGEMAPGMDVPAQIMYNRTMVPLRFVSEFFGAEADWCPDTRSIQLIFR